MYLLLIYTNLFRSGYMNEIEHTHTDTDRVATVWTNTLLYIDILHVNDQYSFYPMIAGFSCVSLKNKTSKEMNDKKQETFSTVMLYWIRNNMLWLLFIFALENDFDNAKLKIYFTESILLLLLFINYTLSIYMRWCHRSTIYTIKSITEAC